MPKVFQTREDGGQSVEIVGLGVLAPNAGGRGITLEDAAQVMSELQSVGGVPLEGKELDEAAQTYAETHGLEVASISEKKRTERQAALRLPAERPPANEVAVQEYKDAYGDAELVEGEFGEPVVIIDATDPAQGADPADVEGADA